MTHTAESNAVAEALGQYSAENPGTTITIVSDSFQRLYDTLKAFEIDCAVAEGKVQDAHIHSLLLDTDSLVLVLSNNHPWANKKRVTLEELKTQPLILRRPSSGTRNLFSAHLESSNLSLDDFNVILEVDNIATIKDLIRRDIGLSILSYSVCLDELRKGKITVLPIQNLSMVREINILYHDDFKHTDLLDDLLEKYQKVKKAYSS